MEYMKGGDLKKYINAKASISISRVREIIHSLSTAIYYMTQFGIVHRDLKLTNIMLEENTVNSNVKIVDFGLSALQGPTDKDTDQIGTLLYISPEIVEGSPYGSEVDIWSMGVISYYLICKEFPFYSKHSSDVVK
jgi:serine/threonine protein kinase